MPAIRNLAFIIVSICALVYLVLQSSQGQRWLLQTSEYTESVIQEQRDSLDKLKTETRNESFNRTTKNDEQDEQIEQLETQLTRMTNDIANLQQAMQEIVRFNNTLAEETQELDNLTVSSNPRKQVQQGTEIPDKLEARQRQLQQQAMLREVVQQMELTALQAINR